MVQALSCTDSTTYSWWRTDVLLLPGLGVGDTKQEASAFGLQRGWGASALPWTLHMQKKGSDRRQGPSSRLQTDTLGARCDLETSLLWPELHLEIGFSAFL